MENGIAISGPGAKQNDQQCLEVLDGLRLCQFVEAVPQVGVGFQSIGGRGGDDPVQRGAGFGALYGVREAPIAPAKSRRSNGIFRQIRIHRESPVVSRDRIQSSLCGVGGTCYLASLSTNHPIASNLVWSI